MITVCGCKLFLFITDFNKIHDSIYFRTNKNEVINLLKRRPCSIEDIQGGLNMHKNEAVKYIEELTKKNIVEIKKQNGEQYYYINEE